MIRKETGLVVGEARNGEIWRREVIAQPGKNRGPNVRLGEGNRVKEDMKVELTRDIAIGREEGRRWIWRE